MAATGVGFAWGCAPLATALRQSRVLALRRLACLIWQELWQNLWRRREGSKVAPHCGHEGITSPSPHSQPRSVHRR
jgi:hypothetical protein